MPSKPASTDQDLPVDQAELNELNQDAVEELTEMPVGDKVAPEVRRKLGVVI